MSCLREAYRVKRISFSWRVTRLSIMSCERRDARYEIRDRAQVPC